MPRRFRLPEGTVRRLVLAAGILFPFVAYLGLRALPATRPMMMRTEARILRTTTRLAQAFRYVVLEETFEANELAACQAQNTTLIQDLAVLRASDVGPVRTLPIEVVSRTYGGDTHRVLLWKAEGDPFLVGEGVGAGKILYGLIVEAKSDLAVVETITSEKSAIPAMILGKEATVGIARGTGGAWLELAYVPKGSDVAIGDSVVTSGLDGSVTRGLVLGTVREVIDADPSPFYRIKVAPMVSPDAWWEGEVFHIPTL